MKDKHQSGDTDENENESNFAIYYERNNTKQMMMVPSTSNLPSNVFKSSVEYNYVDSIGDDHNIELGMDITEALEIISDNQMQINRRRTLCQHNRL